MLGQLDCGFVIWYRAQANRVSPSAELDRSLRHHTRFLKRLLGAGRQRIVIAAAAAEADTTGTTTLATRDRPLVPVTAADRVDHDADRRHRDRGDLPLTR